MSFYTYIENVRFKCIETFNCWTERGARDKAYVVENLYNARNEYNQLEAENAKLQDENARLRSCLSDDAENARMIMGENEKLRELVRDYEQCSMHADCSRCEYDGKMSTHCPFSPCFPDADELRELGVEVDA